MTLTHLLQNFFKNRRILVFFGCAEYCYCLKSTGSCFPVCELSKVVPRNRFSGLITRLDYGGPSADSLDPVSCSNSHPYGQGRLCVHVTPVGSRVGGRGTGLSDRALYRASNPLFTHKTVLEDHRIGTVATRFNRPPVVTLQDRTHTAFAREASGPPKTRNGAPHGPGGSGTGPRAGVS